MSHPTNAKLCDGFLEYDSKIIKETLGLGLDILFYQDWTSAEGQFSSASICEWEHIDCDSMHIDCDSMTKSLREIVLADNNLQRTIANA
jgi:hypothetical protein